MGEALAKLGAAGAMEVLKISVENAIICAVTNQLLSMSLGLTDHFNFQEVVAAVAAAAMGAKLSGVSITGQTLVDAAVKQLNIDVVMAAVGGHGLDLTQVLCDMVQASVVTSVQQHKQALMRSSKRCRLRQRERPRP